VTVAGTVTKVSGVMFWVENAGARAELLTVTQTVAVTVDSSVTNGYTTVLVPVGVSLSGRTDVGQSVLKAVVGLPKTSTVYSWTVSVTRDGGDNAAAG